jgi:hypothetical protein
MAQMKSGADAATDIAHGLYEKWLPATPVNATR